MILKELKIKNFRSYYGYNTLLFSKGLTLVIGDNGDGKTTLFEALEWLFNTTGAPQKESNISEMRKSELEIGESDEVSVSLSFEHDGHKEVEKSFTFERELGGNISLRDYKFVGYCIDGVERSRTEGAKLLDRCFEPVIRTYCLFKGENKLNVFETPDALKTLVETFSGIKDFDKKVDLTKSFEEKAANVVSKALQNDNKVSKQTKELTDRRTALLNEIQEIKIELKEKRKSIDWYSSKLQELESNQDLSERYQHLKVRIKGLEDKRAGLAKHVKCDYNAKLLDESWILRSFPSVMSDFSAKVSALSKAKRRLDKQETERRAMADGKREAYTQIQKLVNDTVPLPWNLPDEQTMKEMIDDEVCKVCGRPAPKGSEPYEFMRHKLQDYLDHVKAEANKKSNDSQEEEKPLFVNSFIDELHSLQIKFSGDEEIAVANTARKISEELEFINARKLQYNEVDTQLNDLETEANNMILQSGLSDELLSKNFSDLIGFFDSKSHAERRMTELEAELKSKEEEVERVKEALSQLEPESTMTQVLQRVHQAFENISKAFENAKTQNINKFLQMLESKSNEYLQKLNEGDFYGVIHIWKSMGDSAHIELCSKNGTRIENPNGALKTTMYMSVLFAISEITTLKREKDYPLIFDAPTSSFGSFNKERFYNVIDSIDKQCVIFTKDLLNVDKETGLKEVDCQTIDKLSCPVLRIEKVLPFNDKDLSTVRTVIKIIR